jgi:uncharacterized metal-binding protein YceD (DUF177 family)
MAPELSRPVAVDRVTDGQRVQVEARPEEREAVARRMGLQAVSMLHCRFDLRREGGQTVQARGTLSARVVQVCVVTLEPFEADLAEEFVVRFVPEGTESETVNVESEDEIPYAGGSIDLGEATSEQLALALDPFPRKPGAVLPDEEPDLAERPFAALAKRQTLS